MNRGALLLTFLLFLFVPFVVNAEECENDKVYIESIKLDQSTNVDELDNATINGKNINLNLGMYKLGDSIRYEINVKNDSNTDYLLDKNSVKVSSKYVDYTIESDDNSNIVKRKSSKIVYLKAQYNNPVPADAYQNGVFNDNITMKVNLSTEDLLNPSTGIKYILLFFVIGIICILLSYNYRKKKLSKLTILLISLSILIPIGVNALCRCDISIESKVMIAEKRQPIIYDYEVENGEITINDYYKDIATHNIDYIVSDQNKCENYLNELLYNDDRYSYIYDEELSDNAKSLCSGGIDKHRKTLGNVIYDSIPSQDYEAAGLSDVTIAPKPGVTGTEVVIPTYIDGYPVTVLDVTSFMYKDLTSVVLPKQLRKIGGADDQGAFAFNNITSIELPDSLDEIGVYAFAGNQLTEVIIPNNVTYIGEGAFGGNNISKLTLGNKVEIIELEAFENNNLKTLRIPSSVRILAPEFAGQFIFDRAFGGNPLTSVIIEGKSSAAEFEKYRNERGTPFSWDPNVTCVKDNDTNVENGCITWMGSN